MRVDDDADAVERQTECFRKLVANAGGKLRRHVDGKPIGAPIGDDRMRLEAAMGLHLRAIFAFDDRIGFGKALASRRRVWRLPARAHCH